MSISQNALLSASKTTPVYTLDVQPWASEGSETCKQCKKSHINTSEVTWIEGEQYDKTAEHHYIPEICNTCLLNLFNRECKVGFLENKEWYVKYGFYTREQVDNDPRNR